MHDKETPKSKRPKAANAREDRLKAALKANLGRRKAQARARQDAGDDKTARDAGGKDGGYRSGQGK